MKNQRKIGIAGAGGIGSNIAVNLIRSGLTNIKIVDFDKIEESNLNRQFYFKDQIGLLKSEAIKINLQRINPEANIENINLKLNKDNIYEVFEDCDIIAEAFDKKEMKSLLIEELTSKSKKLIVSANGIAGHELADISVNKINDKLYIVGDSHTDISKYKTYSTKVSIIAAHMANIILEKGAFYE